MKSKSTCKILPIFLLVVMIGATKFDSNLKLFESNNLPLDFEWNLLNFAISFTLTHGNLNDIEKKILLMLLQFKARQREEAERKREANTVYWYLRQGR